MCAWFNRHFWDWYYIFLNVKSVNKRNYLINICFTLTNLWSSVFEMVPSLEKNEVYCNSCKQYMFEVTPTSRIKKTQVRSDFEAPLILLYVGNHKKDFVSSVQPCHPQEALVYKSIDEKFDILCSIFPNNDHRWHNFVIRLSL